MHNMLEAVQQFREQDTVCITELSKQTEERTVDIFQRGTSGLHCNHWMEQDTEK